MLNQLTVEFQIVDGFEFCFYLKPALLGEKFDESVNVVTIEIAKQSISATDLLIAAMSIHTESVLPKNFSGIVPLFPLPNLVMFPGVVQPLQIFEPRYRAMMEWTLNHEKLIAMAVLKEDESVEHGDRPPVKPVVCVGKIVAHTRLEDGRFKLLLMGGRRARIESELSAPQPFRTARVELLDDHLDVDSGGTESDRYAKLASSFLHHLRTSNDDAVEFKRLIDNDLPLSILTDIVSSAMSLPLGKKYSLLEETDVAHRADLLIGELRKKPDEVPQGLRPTFPPRFSEN